MKNALDSEAKAERERDNAWETCKRALHKVDNLIARAEKAEKDRDVAEAERDDAIRTAQDNAAEVEKMRRDRDQWKAAAEASYGHDLETALSDLAAARALLLAAQEGCVGLRLRRRSIK